jgi:hypothetical protein
MEKNPAREVQHCDTQRKLKLKWCTGVIHIVARLSQTPLVDILFEIVQGLGYGGQIGRSKLLGDSSIRYTIPSASLRDDERSFLLWANQRHPWAAQILGHTQKGVQGMLCTERGPALLPLVIYMDSDSLDISHVPPSRDDVILGVGICGRRCRSTVLESDPWQVIRSGGMPRTATEHLVWPCLLCATGPAPALPARI